eukprot:CAMPEP_0168515922 /NCGR_PEP_ID=MMETSP0405-20121227/5089_1 /TAXON_ID=498012 /ORGANISM="Trichosphaerium sp, Strain Am-I-7 wt" /LENGTH=557 /DNA_ID=CAMNT_0008535523 /DNA_START=83 /DNA_END=1756 /DNA_ORIENTATION=+
MAERKPRKRSTPDSVAGKASKSTPTLLGVKLSEAILNVLARMPHLLNRVNAGMKFKVKNVVQTLECIYAPLIDLDRSLLVISIYDDRLSTSYCGWDMWIYWLMGQLIKLETLSKGRNVLGIAWNVSKELTGIQAMLDVLMRAQIKCLEFKKKGPTLLSAEEIEKLAEEKIDPLFWSQDSGVMRFGSILQILQSSLTAPGVGIDGIIGSVRNGLRTSLSSRARKQVSEEAITNKTEEAVLRVWNFAEHPLVSKFIILLKPLIKHSMSFYPLGQDGPRCKFLHAGARYPRLRPGNKVTPVGSIPVVLHFHGGGFVSGAPESHEVYTRHWAKGAGCLVISVDYTLAPKKKYPTQTNECYDVYKWVTNKMKHEFGVTPKRIILAGDSAGGNLAVSVALKALQDDIRPVDGLLLSYPVLNLTDTATSSKAIYKDDILLSMHVLQTVKRLYLSHPDDANEGLCSPAFASDSLLLRLPKNIHIFSAGIDPLLDDTYEFVHKMRKLGFTESQVTQRIFPSLPHGFFNMVDIPQAREACRISVKVLKEMIASESTKDTKKKNRKSQ